MSVKPNGSRLAFKINAFFEVGKVCQRCHQYRGIIAFLLHPSPTSAVGILALSRHLCYGYKKMHERSVYNGKTSEPEEEPRALTTRFKLSPRLAHRAHLKNASITLHLGAVQLRIYVICTVKIHHLITNRNVTTIQKLTFARLPDGAYRYGEKAEQKIRHHRKSSYQKRAADDPRTSSHTASCA